MEVKIKNRIIWIGLSVLAILVSQRVFADADPSMAYLDVVMSAQMVSVTKNSQTPYSVGAVTGKSKVVGSVGFQNTSGGPETYKIRISSITGDWTLFANADPSVMPGAGSFRLYAIWHNWEYIPDTSEFQAADALTTSDVVSSATTLFNANEDTYLNKLHYTVAGTAHPEYTVNSNPFNGMNIPDQQTRNLFVRYDTPSSYAAGDSTCKATIVVTAISAQ